MKKIFLILGIFCLVLGGYIIYLEKIEDLSLQNTCKNESCMSQSIVKIIEKSDLEIYRKDPYHFFDEVVGTIQHISGGGSGFFVNESGYILTSKHVVSTPDAEYIVVLHDGTEYTVEYMYHDKENDLALIKINTKFEKFSSLEISGRQEKIEHNYSISGLIKTNLALIPGDSGTPFMGKYGLVIGVNTATNLSEKNTSYATQIDSQMIQGLLHNTKKAQK